MLKVIMQSLFSLVVMSLLLLLPIRSLYWPAAWFFIIECGISGLMLSIWLYKYDPHLFKERSRSPLQSGQKNIDKTIMIIIYIAFLIWFPLIAIDANYIHWGYVPFTLQFIGAISVAVCMWICFLVFKVNTFAITGIRVQKNQQVISTGPYSVVRHPMYSGLILFFIGTPLLLGSWLGVLWGILLTILMAIRAIYEEKLLATKLKGYRSYQKKIHYRLIPYIW